MSHAEQAQNLLASDGWKLVEAWLESRIVYHKDQLVICELDKVTEHRAQIKTYKDVLRKPQGIIDEATEVEQRS